MNNKKKVEIFDRIYELLREETEPNKVLYSPGVLSKVQGLNGFKKCEIGTPVYEKGDRYILYMESIDGKTVVEVPYYKEDLSRVMTMNEPVKADI